MVTVICVAAGLVEAVKAIEGLFGAAEGSLRVMASPTTVPASGAVPRLLPPGKVMVPDSGNCPDELGAGAWVRVRVAVPLRPGDALSVSVPT